MTMASRLASARSYVQHLSTGARAPSLVQYCSQTSARFQSTASPAAKAPEALHEAVPPRVTVRGRTCQTDPSVFNVPPHVLAKTARQLHLVHDHPLCITRQILESHFPQPTFQRYHDYHPVVSTYQNFDSLGFPPDHPGRALTDTFYINKTTILRTHTSAHQAASFRANESEGYIISADVYRRDEIDRSHYPIFHQMEGVRSWDRSKVPKGDVVAAVRRDLRALPKHDIAVEDPNPPFHPERNPRQEQHYASEVKAIAEHLKRSLENMVIDVFSRARTAAQQNDPDLKDAPLQMRWVEAYFPFTSPSWELEVFYRGDWLEILGCGIVKHQLYLDAGLPQKLGWAFGIGLDRIAMLLFRIPDIRALWSKDDRFLSQFRGISDQPSLLKLYVSFSKYPPCPKDISFWLPPALQADPERRSRIAKDVEEVARSVAGNSLEEVSILDEFTHPKSGRQSMAFHFLFRSPEQTMTNKDAARLQLEISQLLVQKLGVELR